MTEEEKKDRFGGILGSKIIIRPYQNAKVGENKCIVQASSHGSSIVIESTCFNLKVMIKPNKPKLCYLSLCHRLYRTYHQQI